MSKYINTIKKLESPCVVRFADKQGHFRHTLVCKLGHKYAQLIWIDSSIGGFGIRIHRVLLESVLRYSRPLEEIYIPKKAARKILNAGKILGITKGARKLLKEVVSI
jgi:hypothetical protein